MDDLLEAAWGLIANANGGDWDKATYDDPHLGLAVYILERLFPPHRPVKGAEDGNVD